MDIFADDSDYWGLVPTDLSQIPDTKVSGSPDNGFNKNDGLGVFNSLLGAWLKHDQMSMQTTQPVGYGKNGSGMYPVQQQQSSQGRTFLLIGLVVAAVLIVKN